MDSMGGILTKGLGAPACCGLILAQFNLAKCCQYSVVVVTDGADGGSRPLAPGEIHNFYTPVGQPNPLQPLEYLRPYTPYVPVEKLIITLTVKDQEPITKEYYVPQYRSKVILNITRFIASASGVVTVTAINLRNQMKKRIQVLVNNLRKR